ncbi:response regulator [Paenibacillus sp.]|uniref:response regulator transcription factor n=1 Tax=Paenibacillus sp. TaxID=58172 RepID=UPI002812399E|nr:response regulator [Paenibacillus sp.]
MTKIMLADDEPALRFLITETLAEEGYGVKEAEDGREAVRLLQSESFDVVILDYMMPELTGVEVCEWLRRTDGDNRDKPVILLTAKAQQKDKDQAIAAGATEYMIKPFSPLQLLELVDRLAGGAR